MSEPAAAPAAADERATSSATRPRAISTADESATGEVRSAVSKTGIRVDVVADRLGTVYEVGKAIGKGKFSTVYKAMRRADALPVALKRVAIFDIMDEKSREKCLKEIQLVQSLDHQNIIRFLDGFIENNELILVFEYAEAGDLKRQLRKAKEREARFDERVIWKYFSQIAEAVAHMHAKRIMHRDLKPANIFLTLNGTVKVGDLGLGRLMSENTMEAHSKVGTPLYMSPEVLRGKGYEFTSDIWSLGCILYELAMLRSPFKEEGLNLYGLFQKITEGKYPPVSPVYSDELRALVDRMLQQDPGARPDIVEVCAMAAQMRDKTTRSRALSTAAAAPAPASGPPVHAAGEIGTAAAPPPAMPSRPTSANANVVPPPRSPLAAVAASIQRVSTPERPGSPVSGQTPSLAGPPTVRTDMRDDDSPRAELQRPTPTAAAANDDTDNEGDAPVAYVQIMEAAAAVARDAGLPDPFPERPGSAAVRDAAPPPPSRGRARPDSASRRGRPLAALAVSPGEAGIAFQQHASPPMNSRGSTGRGKSDGKLAEDDGVTEPPASARPSASLARPPKPFSTSGITPSAAQSAGRPHSISPAHTPVVSTPIAGPSPARMVVPPSPLSDGHEATIHTMHMEGVTPRADTLGTGTVDRLPIDSVLELVDSSPEIANELAFDYARALLWAPSAGFQPSKLPAARSILDELRDKHFFATPSKSALLHLSTFIRFAAIFADLTAAAKNSPPAWAGIASDLSNLAEGLRAGELPPFTAVGTLLQLLPRATLPPAVSSPPSSITPTMLATGTGPAVVKIAMHFVLTACVALRWIPPGLQHTDGDADGEPAEEVPEDAVGDESHVQSPDALSEDDEMPSGMPFREARTPATVAPGAVEDGTTLSPQAVQAWRAETERVRSRLAAIDRGTVAVVGGDDSARVLGSQVTGRAFTTSTGWYTRLASLARHARVVEQIAALPDAAKRENLTTSALLNLSRRCQTDLETIAHAEGRWNSASSGTGDGIPTLVGQYRATREHSEELLGRVNELRHSVTLLANQSEAVDEQIAAIQEQLEERNSEMTSTGRLQTMRKALVDLRRESAALDIELQLARTRVFRNQLASPRLNPSGARNVDSGDGTDEDYR